MFQEIRFSGFGGQGIIRSGYIVGKAASLFDSQEATMTQSFGPEARGSSCSSQLIVSDSPISYPYVTLTDVLVAMSQEAYDKYLPQLRPKGVVLLDDDLVKNPKDTSNYRIFSIPATRIAEELGNRIVANLVMLGFFTAVTGIVSERALKEAIPGSVPDGALELNIKAFEHGYQYGLQQTGKSKVRGDSEAKLSAVAT